MKAYDIRGMRMKHRIPQLAFAVHLGLRQDTLRDIERGAVDISDEEYARLLAEMKAFLTQGFEGKKVGRPKQATVTA